MTRKYWPTVAIALGILVAVSTDGQACMTPDVQAMCCPAACAAKAGPHWPDADEVLRGCMRGLGCDEPGTRSATVSMMCWCGR